MALIKPTAYCTAAEDEANDTVTTDEPSVPLRVDSRAIRGREKATRFEEALLPPAATEVAGRPSRPMASSFTEHATPQKIGDAARYEAPDGRRLNNRDEGEIEIGTGGNVSPTTASKPFGAGMAPLPPKVGEIPACRAKLDDDGAADKDGEGT